jgi:shikimate kinase
LENNLTLKRVRNLDNLNSVISTTGSCIYLRDLTLRLLKVRTKIVYLDSDFNFIDDMVQRYKQDKKPVIWDKGIVDKVNEQNVTDSFATLLKTRREQYLNLASLTISYTNHQNPDFDLLEYLNKTLTKTHISSQT